MKGRYHDDTYWIKIGFVLVAAFFVASFLFPIKIPIYGMDADTLNLENQLYSCNQTIRHLENKIASMQAPPADLSPLYFAISIILIAFTLLMWDHIKYQDRKLKLAIAEYQYVGKKKGGSK